MVVQYAAGGAVIPFVILLFRDRGLDFSRISLILTASSATLLGFPFLWGMLADRYVPLNRLSTALNLLAAVALAALAAQKQFTGLLAAYTCYFACFNPMLTLLNALGFHHLPRPSEQFGRLRAWGSVGWIVPFVPIALWLARDARAGLDFTLYLGIGLCLAMVALSFWLPHTPPGARRASSEIPTKDTYGPAVKRLLRDPNYVIVLLSMFLVAGSYSLLMYYSPPYLEIIGVPRPWIGPVQAIGVVFEIVLLQGQAGLIRRWNYTAVALIGAAALLLRHLMFALLDDVWLLALSYLLAGAVIVFFHLGISVLVNTMAGLEVRATAQTLLVFVGQGLGPMFANWVAGRLAGHYGNSLRPVFLFAAGLAGMAMVLLAFRGRQLNRAGQCEGVENVRSLNR